MDMDSLTGLNLAQKNSCVWWNFYEYRIYKTVEAQKFRGYFGLFFSEGPIRHLTQLAVLGYTLYRI